MLEFILEILGEFVLQAVIEVLGELGLRSVSEPFRRPPNPWLAALGYLILGSVAGGLSLLVFPAHLVGEHLRLANLLLTPCAVGLLMAGLGSWRQRQGQATLRIDRFSYGFLFAFSLALVRFCCAD